MSTIGKDQTGSSRQCRFEFRPRAEMEHRTSHQWHPSPTLGALPKSSPEAAMRGGADAGLEVGNAPRDYGTGCLWSIPSDTSDRSSVDLYRSR